MVIFGPIFQVGCARASLTDALASSSRFHPRNGPPEAVMITLRRSSRRSPRRHWASAACSESTGTSRSGSPFTRSMTSSPPTIRLSLFASASIFPDWRVASVGPSPTAPTMALTTMSASESRARRSAASGPAITSTRRRPDRAVRRSSAARSSLTATTGGRNSRICPTSSSWLWAAASPTTSNRSWFRRTTSRACVPIDPVEPRITTRRTLSRVPAPRGNIRRRARSEGQQQEVVGGRGGEEDGVDPVKDPTVPGEDGPHVLDAEVSLEGRLDQVADRSHQGDHQAEPDGGGAGEGVDGRYHGQGHDQDDQRPPDRSLPRLVRADRRRQRAVPPQRAHRIGGHVVQDRQTHHNQEGVPPHVPREAQQQQRE